MPAAAIQIPGPGPPEPHARDASASPLPPAKPSELVSAGGGSSTELIEPAESAEAETQDTHDTHDTTDGNGDEEEPASPAPVAADPYANLDNAFGSYLADEPRPQSNNQLAGLI